MSLTYLVTGGAGFIGSHLVDELVSRKQHVRVFDNFATGRRDNLVHVMDRIDLVEGDVRDYAGVVQAMQGVDYVLHQAAMPSVQRSVVDPLTTHQVNATGTLNVLQAARKAGVKRFVCASSSSVYGNSPGFPKREEMPTGPMSPYATSKLAGENYCRVFHHVYNMPTVVLRYFNVFGPRQDPNSQYSAVVPKFITAAMRGEKLVIFGDGCQSRDFTYVSNVVAANLMACQAPGVEGQVMNISSGRSYSLLDLVNCLKRLLQLAHLKVQHLEARPGDVRRSQGDIQKATDLLGYVPQVNFETGLGHVIESFK